RLLDQGELLQQRGRTADPANAQARRQRLREGAAEQRAAVVDRAGLLDVESRDWRHVLALEAQLRISGILDDDRTRATGKREGCLTVFDGKRFAGRVGEVRDKVEDARRGDVRLCNAVLEADRAVLRLIGREGLQRTEIGRRQRDYRAARINHQLADEVQRLLRAVRD